MWPFRRKKRLVPSTAEIVGKTLSEISMAFVKAFGFAFAPIEKRWQIKRRMNIAWEWHLQHWRQLTGE